MAIFSKHVFAELHIDPARLDLGRVDAAMRPLVERINASGWVWTTESCQGHDESPAMLGLSTNDIGRAMTALAEALMQHPNIRPNRLDPNTPVSHVAFYAPSRLALGRYQVRISIANGLDVLRSFAERLD